MAAILVSTALTAFISSIMGGIIPIIKQKRLNHYPWMHYVDSFCDGMFIAIATTHLLPEIYEDSSTVLFAGYCLLIICMIAAIQYSAKVGNQTKTKSFIAALLFSHCFFEGLAVSLATNAQLQTSLSIAILAHKIIESFVFFNLIVRQNWSLTRLFLLLIIFSLLTPAGLFAGQYIKHTPTILTGLVNALTCGAFIGIGMNCYLLHSCNDHSHSSTIWLGIGFLSFCGLMLVI